MNGLPAWSYPLLVLVPLAALAVARPALAGRPIALTDAALLARPARRTRGAMLALALLVVVGAAAVALALRAPRSAIGELVPGGSTTVVVLDMSASVSDLVYDEIARTIELISASPDDTARVGLVLFSDVAQEALPPGTRPSQLEPFRRFFLPLAEPDATPRPDYYRPAGPSAAAPTKYVLSPWFRTFGGGTAISTGLATAREALERDGVAGRVLLVSDLDNKGEDTPALTRELLTYAERGIDLDVVAVPPAIPAQVELMQRVLGTRTTVVESAALRRPGAQTGSRGPAFPIAAAVVVALVALALGWYRHAYVPLDWEARAR